MLDFIIDEEKCTAIPQIVHKNIPISQLCNYTIENRGDHQVLLTGGHVTFYKFRTVFSDVIESRITPELLQELRRIKEKELIAKKERKEYAIKSAKCISKSPDNELAITTEDPKRIFFFRKRK